MTSVRDDQLPRGAGTAAPVDALPAASVLVLRDGPLEVLMLRRNEKSSFVPGAWVFPGGITEPIDRDLAQEHGDGSVIATMRVTAGRETFEETGVWLGEPLGDAEHKRRRLLAGNITLRHLLTESPVDFTQLVWTARWITPVGIPKRFDTYFFLAKATRDVIASGEDNEAVEVAWIAPAEALTRHEAGTMPMVFPTIKNLEALLGYDTADALLDARRGAEIPTIQPVLVVENGQKKLVIP
jgi:8-oxo-dGTP pyrophosphatase MutT (NUDIX family)